MASEVVESGSEWPARRVEAIDLETAFDALHSFVASYVERGQHRDDGLLNLQFWTDRQPGGPPVEGAMWTDWLEAVEAAKARQRRD